MVIPVDIAIQPGDGGWGILLETLGHRRVFANAHVYAAGSYLFNPRETNDAVTTLPVYGKIRNLSVPDQYLARVGLSYAPARPKGLSVSLGGRIDGIPIHDRFGGSTVFGGPAWPYVEPGAALTRGASTYSVFLPVAVYRNRQVNVYDIEAGRHGPGAFADFLVIASVTRQF